MAIHNFKPAFLDHFNITSFFQPEKNGGQKSVYFPIKDGKKCVLKTFRGGINERTQRELEIYEEFKHVKGISKIIEVATYGSDTLVFEEFIDGNTLSDISQIYLEKPREIADLLKEIISILDPIWRKKYVHRNIKPENIIIEPSGKPIVIDFGIARDLDSTSLTGTGFQPKSWRFAAPEQFAGQKAHITYKTDFFSLGSLAFYLHQGHYPFGNSEAEVHSRFQGIDQSFKLDNSCPLYDFCKAALKFSPAERPRLIEDLNKLL